MNISFDDTDPYLIYSPEWRVQPPTDPNLALFWQGTYHGCQIVGCNVSLTFNGAGVYLYGSKGPNHANFSVQVDNRVFYLSALAPTPQYQQLLYGGPLKAGTYDIVLTNTGPGPGWLDLDLFSITQPLPDGVSAQTNPGSYPTTVGVGPNGIPTPPVSTGSAGASTPAPTATTPASALPMDLAIAFGALLALTAALFLGYILASRRRARSTRRPPVRPKTMLSPGSDAGGLYEHRNTHLTSPFPYPDAESAAPSVMYIGRASADALSRPSRDYLAPDAASGRGLPELYEASAREVVSPETSVSVLSASYDAPSVRAGKGKQWRTAAPPPVPRRPGAGAESIRTFVHVMDEEASVAGSGSLRR